MRILDVLNKSFVRGTLSLGRGCTSPSLSVPIKSSTAVGLEKKFSREIQQFEGHQI